MVSVSYTQLEIFISMLQSQRVAFHIRMFRLFALGFVHRCRPLYIIHLNTDFPQMLLVLSYQSPGGLSHYYYCHWMSDTFFSAPLILVCLYSHLLTAEAVFSTQKKTARQPEISPVLWTPCTPFTFTLVIFLHLK